MMRAIVFFLLICFFSMDDACLADDFRIVESNQVQLEGNLMILEGPLILENEMGKISAKKATLSLTNKDGKLQFHHALLEENVSIEIRGEGVIRCQRAEFDNDKRIADFYAAVEAGDFVTSHLAGIDLQARKMRLILSQGNEGSHVKSIDAEQDVTIRFEDQLTTKSHRAFYDGSSLLLFDHIEADFGIYGTLRTSDEIHLNRDPNGVIGSIRCLGKSIYHCENDEKDLDLEFKVTREIFVDHRNRKIHLISESDRENMIADDKQIFIRDHLGRVYCDRGSVDYDFGKEEFLPKSINLEGNVRLLNRGGAALQYAIADSAIYSHHNQQMRLKSAHSKRVLVYDKINNLQVSAPEIQMQRDRQTKKQQFKGIGDVRFHFAEKEYEQIRKRFQLDKKKL